MEQALPAQAPGGRAYAWLVRWVAHRHAALRIAVLAFVLALPAIATGLAADDFDLALSVTRAEPWSAYAFQERDPALRAAKLAARREAGMAPWWIDLRFHQAFLRPLASLSLAADFRLWPNAPWWMHVENALLFAAIVLIAGSLYRALGLPPAARGLATFFFAMHPAQSMTTGWISGRSTLLATLFGTLAVRLYVGARQSGRVALGLAAAGSFALALAGAEAGVAALAYVAAFELVGPGRASGALGTPRGWLTLAGRLSPFGLVLLVWLAVYRAGGYGTLGSGFYYDAVRSPGIYLINLLAAIPIYLASVLTVPFASSSGGSPRALAIVAVLSLAILYGSRLLWWPWLQRDATARVFGLGALLAVLPLGSSVPQDRLVSFIALGVCGLVALIVQERFAPGCELPRAGALRLFRFHAWWGPALYVPFLFGSLANIAGGGAVVLDRALSARDLRPVVLINAASHLPVHFLGAMRQWRGEASPVVDLLYCGGAEVELRRAGERSLELRVERGYFASPFERIDRDPRQSPLRAGDVVELSRLRATVLAVREDAPTRVRFDFHHELAADRVYAWSGRELAPLRLPEVGGTVRIRPTSAM